jgi:hypothetical protein
MIATVSLDCEQLLKRHFRKYTENRFINFYIKQVDVKVFHQSKIVYLDLPVYVQGKINSTGKEAYDLLPSAFQQLDQDNQRKLFPSWLDDYVIQLRFGLREPKLLRGSQPHCDGCFGQ